MNHPRNITALLLVLSTMGAGAFHRLMAPRASTTRPVVDKEALETLAEGRRVFRFDTFGDEAFWGGELRLHEAIAGSAQGGVGPGLSPRTALALGLKVDSEALPKETLRALRAGLINLDDPAVTLPCCGRTPSWD